MITHKSNPLETDYRRFIQPVADADAKEVIEKDKQYGASWKRRGGVGAFMMLARKMDRIEEQVKKYDYDIFAAISEEMKEYGVESIIDTLRDLRRYGLLIEAEMVATGNLPLPNSKSPSVVDSGMNLRVPEPAAEVDHLKSLRTIAATCSEGSRYGAFHDFAKTMGQMGAGGSEILADMVALNQIRTAKGIRPLPDAEIHQILKGINKQV